MSVETVLAALYLRGAPRPIDLPRRGWPEVVAALRRHPGDDPVSVLQDSGATLAATLLEDGYLLAWADEAVENGLVLTAVSEGYPLRWFDAFGDLAPPALWRRGALPKVSWIGAVGSREIDDEVADYMAEISAAAVTLGRGIVSGGAAGCDSAAEAAALAKGGPVLRILPHGIHLRSEEDGAVCLSLAAPTEPFSRPLAMERNALIYGAAEATVVGHARMRKGGTWHGATEALRRRLGRLLVRPDDTPAFRALKALGAEELPSPNGLEAALNAPPRQRPLFAYEHRRRRAYRA